MKESKLKNTLHDCLRNRNLMIELVILLSIIVIAILAVHGSPYGSVFSVLPFSL